MGSNPSPLAPSSPVMLEPVPLGEAQRARLNPCHRPARASPVHVGRGTSRSEKACPEFIRWVDRRGEVRFRYQAGINLFILNIL